MPDRQSDRLARAVGIGASEINNVGQVQAIGGLYTGVSIFLTAGRVPVLYHALNEGVHAGVRLDGGHGDDGSLDRGYEFPPHRGRRFDREYHRPYYESEGEEEEY